MKIQRFNESPGVSLLAEQPNFDDERTLQSARPVVPLEKINAKLKHRRRWFLGGAFAMAMLLGAASAVISAYFNRRDVPSSGVAQLEISSPAPVVEEVSAEVVDEEPAKPLPSKRTSTRPRLVNGSSEPLGVPRLSEDEELERIRDAVLTEEWQERRQRRAIRERRRTDRYNHRDLSNLDEIFEGRRRP